MAMNSGAKLLLAAGAGLGALLLFSGSSSAAAPVPRGPWLSPIDEPANEAPPYNTLDEAICQCHAAGVRDSAELVSCALRRVYPDVPWPAQDGDHVSVMRTWQATGLRVAQFLTAVANGENPCAVVDGPVGPGGEEPPSDNVVDNLDPWIDDGQNSFGRIVAGSNPSRLAARMYGIPNGDTANLRRALAYVATTGFNLVFYGIPHAGNDYGRGQLNRANGQVRYYDIGNAWRPLNMDPAVAVTSGEKLRRQIAWTAGNSGIPGVAPGSPRVYGKPWYPEASQLGGIFTAAYQSPWAPQRNPPIEVLRALGWPGGVDELRTAWENSPNA